MRLWWRSVEIARRYRGSAGLMTCCICCCRVSEPKDVQYIVKGLKLMQYAVSRVFVRGTWKMALNPCAVAMRYVAAGPASRRSLKTQPTTSCMLAFGELIDLKRVHCPMEALVALVLRPGWLTLRATAVAVRSRRRPHTSTSKTLTSTGCTLSLLRLRPYWTPAPRRASTSCTTRCSRRCSSART